MYQRIDAGTLIGKGLKSLGHNVIFALQGGHIDPILYGAAKEGIKVFDTRHEQGAALMAEAYAIITGQTGVCLVTAGPGFTNSLTGIANVYINQTPLLLLAGKRPQMHAETWTLQELNQLSIIEPISCWAKELLDPKRAIEYLRSALSVANATRPGPVYLEIAADILAKPLDAQILENKISPVIVSKPFPDVDLVSKAAEMIEKAKKPVIVAGSGARWSNAGRELSELASKGIPLFTANAGRGVVSDEHEWCFGPATPMNGAFLGAITNADLIITIGTRFGFLYLNGMIFGNTKVIRVDKNPEELARGVPSALNIESDAGAFAISLANSISSKPDSERILWRDEINVTSDKSLVEFDAQKTGPEGLIHPAFAVKTMVEVGGNSASYVTDGGDAMTFGMTRFPATRPGQAIGTSVYFGALGVGIPYAIASKIANPDFPVLLWEGDGAFGFNAMEFDTAIRHKIPFVCVVANNNVWGMSYHGQGLQYGYDELHSVEIGNRPYHEVVRALGGFGISVSDPDELKPAIEKAIASDMPACVNVQIDKSVVSVATSAMASIGLG